MGIFSGVGDFFSDVGRGAGHAVASTGRGIYSTTGELKDQLTGKNAADASREAAGIQKSAADAANAEARRQFDLSRSDQSPWLNIGRANLERLNGEIGSGGFETPIPGEYDGGQYQDPGEFSAANLENDPGYQFRLAQGLKSVQNSRAGAGSLHSGATLKALMGYGQGLASEEVGNAFNRFNTNRNFGRSAFESNRNFGAGQRQQTYANRSGASMDRFNRLSALAGTGQAAAQNLGAQGANFSQAFGNNAMGGANAQAAGRVGAANAYTGAFNNLLNFGAKVGTAVASA